MPCAWTHNEQLLYCFYTAAALQAVDKKTEAASCDDNKIEDDCLDSKDPACAWCAGNYITGKCMSSFAAKFIPSIIAECKSAETDDDDDDDDDEEDVSWPSRTLLLWLCASCEALATLSLC